MVIVHGSRLTRESGKELLLFGLSNENVKWLKAGNPIRVVRETHGESIREDQEFVIMFGKTEKAIHKKLVELGFVSDPK